MVTLLEPWTNGQKQFAGLSTDEKPVNDVRNGDLFIEMDTGVWYLFDADGGTWHAASSGGSSGGGGETVQTATVTFYNTSTSGTYFVSIDTIDEPEATIVVPKGSGETLGEISVEVPLDSDGEYTLLSNAFKKIVLGTQITYTGAVEETESDTFIITGDCSFTATGGDAAE